MPRAHPAPVQELHWERLQPCAHHHPAPYLDVEGPGTRDDLKKVVPHQEVTETVRKGHW